MLCRADSFLDELSPIQTPFLIASPRRSRTRANSPVPLLRGGGERERSGSGHRSPGSVPVCTPASARGVLGSVSPSRPGCGERGASEAGRTLPGPEGDGGGVGSSPTAASSPGKADGCSLLPRGCAGPEESSRERNRRN